MNCETSEKLAETALAALEMDSKCSCTACTRRFFAHFCLAIIRLIEFLRGLLHLSPGRFRRRMV